MGKKSKYSSVKTRGYDSKKEARRADVLKLMEKSGYISDLREQVSYEILPSQYVKDYNGKEVCGRMNMRYVADFVYVENGKTVVEDCKGYRTPEYKRKKRLMKLILNIEIKET